MYVCGLVHAMAHLRSEDNVQESSLPTMWVLGIKLRLLGLTAAPILTYLSQPSFPIGDRTFTYCRQMTLGSHWCLFIFKAGLNM